MNGVIALHPGRENCSPETLNRLPEFPARACITTQSSGPGLGNILYADNDAPMRGFAAQILSGSGYTVTPVEDGLQAWAALHSHSYELLITGDSMPGMTGLELAAQTRLEGMKLPIIVALGAVEFQLKADYDWLSVTAKLRKPFGTEELLKTVRQVLCTATNAWRSNDTCFPGASEIFKDITPYRHWGINE